MTSSFIVYSAYFVALAWVIITIHALLKRSLSFVSKLGSFSMITLAVVHGYFGQFVLENELPLDRLYIMVILFFIVCVLIVSISEIYQVVVKLIDGCTRT